MRRIVLGLLAVTLFFGGTQVAMAGGPHHHGRGYGYGGYPARYAAYRPYRPGYGWGPGCGPRYPAYPAYPTYGAYPAAPGVGVGFGSPNFSFWLQQ